MNNVFTSTLVYGTKAGCCYLASYSVADCLMNTVGKQRRKTCYKFIFRSITIRFVWNKMHSCTIHGVITTGFVKTEE